MATPEELIEIIELRKEIEQSIKNAVNLLESERKIELEKDININLKRGIEEFTKSKQEETFLKEFRTIGCETVTMYSFS